LGSQLSVWAALLLLELGQLACLATAAKLLLLLLMMML
jgi:hypothetical protein